MESFINNLRGLFVEPTLIDILFSLHNGLDNMLDNADDMFSNMQKMQYLYFYINVKNLT